MGCAEVLADTLWKAGESRQISQCQVHFHRGTIPPQSVNEIVEAVGEILRAGKFLEYKWVGVHQHCARADLGTIGEGGTRSCSITIQ